jgi:hypothetical protein
MLRRFLLIIMMGVYGATSALASTGEEWCIDRAPSEDKKQLTCLKSIDVSIVLRKTFNKIAQMKKTCPKCKSSIVGEEELQSLFQLPFLVIAITYPTQGGAYSACDMHIIFKERPTRDFEIGIDYAQKNLLEAQVVVAMAPSKKMEKLIKRLSQKEYVQYWMK